MIRSLLLSLLVVFSMLLAPLALAGEPQVQAASDKYCGQSGSSILGFPTWYKYLNPHFEDGECKLDVSFPGSLPKILIALVDIALRIAALVAIGFVIYGGFRFILSQGEPDKTAAARRSIINALVGLVIAVMATIIVSFIAGVLT